MKNLVTEYPAWAILLCPLFGLGFALLLYFRDRRLLELSTSVTVLLGVLRFICISFIAFLLLGPLLRYLESDIEPPAVVIGIDNSSSLAMGGDSLENRAAIQGLLQSVKSSLGENYDVLTYSFGQEVREGFDSTLTEPLTDIAAFFESLKGRYANRNLGAVILASDGIYNRGSNPRYATAGLNAPVYTIALGDTSRKLDALVAEVAANRIAFLGNKFPVEARLRADKLNGQNITYNVNKGGKIIETGSFTAEGDRSEKTVRFLLEATEIGLQRFTINVNAVPGEVTLANNQRAVFVDVIDSRQKVLILAHAPHPDLLALRQAISGNENYEVDLAFESEFAGNVGNYDLVVLHQIPAASTNDQLRNSLIGADLPILAIVGSQSILSQLSNYGIGVSLSGSKNTSNDVGATVNKGAGLFQIDPNFDAFLREAPPLRSPFGDWRLSNASQIILAQRVGNIVTQDPLLVASKTNGRKNAVLLGEGIWRWRLYDYAKNESHDTFDKFISSLVQFLSVKDDKRLFRVQAPTDVMENERLLLNAELYNAAFEPVNDAEVTVVFTDEEGKSFPFTFSRNEQAYRLDAGVLPVGNYNFKATTFRSGEELNDRGSFTIRPFALEAAELTADHNLLSSIAENTRGKCFIRVK